MTGGERSTGGSGQPSSPSTTNTASASASASNPTSTAGPVLAVVVAAALFGSTGTIASLGPDELPAVAAGAWRSVIGGALMVAVAAARSQPVWAHALMDRRVWIGGVGVMGYQLAFFESVERTGVAVGTLVTIGVGPIVAGLLDSTMHRRAPSTRWILGTVIAISGVALLTLDAPDADPVGVALAVVAACSFPVYGAAAQDLMRDRPVLPAITATFGAGAVLLAPLAILTAPDAFASTGSISVIVTLGVATLAVAYVLWGVGLRSLSLSVVVTVTLVEPAVASGLAVLVLDEAFTASLVFGLALVAAGVRISASGDRTRVSSDAT